MNANNNNIVKKKTNSKSIENIYQSAIIQPLPIEQFVENSEVLKSGTLSDKVMLKFVPNKSPTNVQSTSKLAPINPSCVVLTTNKTLSSLSYTNIQFTGADNNQVLNELPNGQNTMNNSNNSNNNNNNKMKNSNYRCDICNKTFVTSYNKRRHYEMIHNQIIQKGTTNEQQRIPIQLAQLQTNTAFLPNIFVTPNQGTLSTIAPTQLIINNKNTGKKITCSLKEKIPCDRCNKTFSTPYNKRRHEDMVHGQNSRMMPTYKCSSCDKVFYSTYNKTRHENIHKPITERLKHICPKCEKGFTTPFILKSHMQKIHQIQLNQYQLKSLNLS